MRLHLSIPGLLLYKLWCPELVAGLVAGLVDALNLLVPC